MMNTVDTIVKPFARAATKNASGNAASGNERKKKSCTQNDRGSWVENGNC